MSWYDAIPEDKRYCYVHVDGWEPSPEPTESLDPWDIPSGEPTWPPEETDEPYIPIPPTQDPEPIVTIEPPQPTVEIPTPPAYSEEPYIPVDQWGNPMYPSQ